MAIKTFHVLNTAAVTPNWNSVLQEGGSAPAAALSVYGWTVTKVAAAYWIARLGATARTTTSQGTSWIDVGEIVRVGTSGTLTSDAFRSPTPYTGAFAAGNWTFNFGMRTGAASHAGRMRVQIWAGPNPDASGTNRRLGSDTAGSIITLAATGTTYTSTVTINPGAVTLNNEYLFFAVEWQGTTAGTSNSCTTQFYQSACTITTPDFVATVTGTLATTETADDATMSGGVVVGGSVATTEAADTFAATGTVVIPSSRIVVSWFELEGVEAVLAAVTGTLNTTEAADDATLAGTVAWPDITGTLDVDETADDATITGTVAWPVLTGTLDADETADDATLTGTVAWPILTGTLDADETADDATFTGTVAWPLISGTLDTDDAADDATFAGAVAWSAALDADETADDATFTGTVSWQPVTGTLGVNETADDATFSGTVAWPILTGTFGVNEIPDDATFTGGASVDLAGGIAPAVSLAGGVGVTVGLVGNVAPALVFDANMTTVSGLGLSGDLAPSVTLAANITTVGAMAGGIAPTIAIAADLTTIRALAGELTVPISFAGDLSQVKELNGDLALSLSFAADSVSVDTDLAGDMAAAVTLNATTLLLPSKTTTSAALMIGV